ncbi:MAG: DUF3365 domain-containing protein [Coriobacteriales bacterium]|nr:DUF3365 domain-containing protein [Coriobacteriales bacterium]
MASRFGRKEPAALGLRIKVIGLLALVFIILIGADIVLTSNFQRAATASELLEESRVLVKEMDAVWNFISLNQDNINYNSNGEYDYKGLHCAIAGRAVAALFSQDTDYEIHFVNLDPRNFINTPDEYETEALERMLAAPDDADESYGFSAIEGESVFRYVKAMRVSEDCVDCHGMPAGEIDPTGYPKEGWKTGDIAGAVSVTAPARLYLENTNRAIVNSVILFISVLTAAMVIVYLVLSRLVIRPLLRLQTNLESFGQGSYSKLTEGNALYATKEMDELFVQFNEMADSLTDIHGKLESQVMERTEQLQMINDELSSRKQLMEQLNQRLQRENIYKSDFLAIISHELRTPLTSIIAFTDLLVEAMPDIDGEAKRQLDEIEQNSRILLEMVENILETARIQQGSERLDLELVDINDVIAMVEATSDPLAKKRGVELCTRVDANVPLIVSDWEKLRRIIVNLVSNAIKFTDPGGHVTVSVSKAGDSSIRVDVSDDGIGIPKDKQELIFERFTQENMSTVRCYGGSGLGLSLVKAFCLMLGGSVSVLSAPGQGSTFTVILPVETLCGDGEYEDNADR